MHLILRQSLNLSACRPCQKIILAKKNDHLRLSRRQIHGAIRLSARSMEPLPDDGCETKTQQMCDRDALVCHTFSLQYSWVFTTRKLEG